MEARDRAQSITESNSLINENRDWFKIKHKGSKLRADCVTAALPFWPLTPGGLGKAREKSEALTPLEAEYRWAPKASSSHLSEASVIPVQRILPSVFWSGSC